MHSRESLNIYNNKFVLLHFLIIYLCVFYFCGWVFIKNTKSNHIIFLSSDNSYVLISL